MFMRCAYFLGKPVPGQEEELHRRMVEVAQRYLGFEQVRSVQLLTSAHGDEGAPDLYATLQLCYDSEDDMNAALAMPYRHELRAHFAELVLPLFEGSVKHVNHHVDTPRRPA